jgi:VanZ family protein
MRPVIPLLPKPIRWLGVLVIAGFIFYTSVLTVPPEVAVQDEGVFTFLAQITQFAQDKWRHFAAYGVLAYSLAYAIEHWEQDRWYRALIVVTVVGFYGFGIELIQYTQPNRYFTVGDTVANTIGSLLVLGWYSIRPYLETRQLEYFFERL